MSDWDDDREARAAVAGWQRTQRLSPCVDQTEAEIARYYRSAPMGAVAVVRHTQGGLLQYDVTEVEGQNPGRGRVYIKNAGAFYAKHGRNCYQPKGQTALVVPTPAVLEWARAHPRGEFGLSIYRPKGDAANET